MRDIAAVRSYVREFLDLEEEDMSNTLIDAWIAEGYRKIVRAAKRWPYFELTWTLTTTADTREVTRPTDLEEVGSVEGPYGNLMYIDHGQAVNDFNQYRAMPSSGTPECWSEHAGVIYIWPTPSEELTLTVTGWRSPADWMAGGSGAVPDFPEDCDDALLAWVMHRAYTHQDDPELAMAEVQRYQAAVDEMVSSAVQAPLAAPLVMGGGRRRPTCIPGERPVPWGS